MSAEMPSDPSPAPPQFQVDDVNPYRPPASPLEVSAPEASDATFPDASGGKRFANYLIDLVGLLLTGFVLVIPVAVLEEFGVLSGWIDSLDAMSRFESSLLSVVLGLIYYTGLESIRGRTLGKLVTGTKVLSKTGTKPTVGQLIIRTLVRSIPFEPVSFLLGGGWHDRWSRTRVVDLRDTAGRDALKRRNAYLARLAKPDPSL